MMEFLSTLPSATIVLFFIGLVFISIEAFIPGFGIAGISGVIALALSVILAARTFAEGAVLILIILVILCIALVFLAWFLTKGKLSPRLILKDENSRELGFSSSSDFSHIVGIHGRAETPLRPAGRVVINKKTYDVVTDGEYISKGEDVVVLEVNGSQIIVGKASVMV